MTDDHFHNQMVITIRYRTISYQVESGQAAIGVSGVP